MVCSNNIAGYIERGIQPIEQYMLKIIKIHNGRKNIQLKETPPLGTVTANTYNEVDRITPKYKTEYNYNAKSYLMQVKLAATINYIRYDAKD